MSWFPSRSDPRWDERVALIFCVLAVLAVIVLGVIAFVQSDDSTPSPGSGEVCGTVRSGKASHTVCVTTTSAP